MPRGRVSKIKLSTKPARNVRTAAVREFAVEKDYVAGRRLNYGSRANINFIRFGEIKVPHRAWRGQQLVVISRKKLKRTVVSIRPVHGDHYIHEVIREFLPPGIILMRVISGSSDHPVNEFILEEPNLTSQDLTQRSQNRFAAGQFFKYRRDIHDRFNPVYDPDIGSDIVEGRTKIEFVRKTYGKHSFAFDGQLRSFDRVKKAGKDQEPVFSITRQLFFCKHLKAGKVLSQKRLVRQRSIQFLHQANYG